MLKDAKGNKALAVASCLKGNYGPPKWEVGWFGYVKVGSLYSYSWMKVAPCSGETEAKALAEKENA